MKSYKILNLLVVIALAFSFCWQASYPVTPVQAASLRAQPGTQFLAPMPAAPSKDAPPTPGSPGKGPRDPHQNIPDAEMDLETESLSSSPSAFASAAAVTAAPFQPNLVSPADGAAGVSTSPDLKVLVSDPDSASLTVNFYGRAAQDGSQASPGDKFTIVALPDTQNYTTSSSRAQIFNSQTQWIANNQNIAYVAHLGDMVNDADKVESEWKIADSAMRYLEDSSNLIPYGVAIGNNDTAKVGVATLYNKYFGISRFQGRSYYGGHYGSNNNNHYSLFNASGMDFITIYLEYDSTPEAAILSWADSLLKQYSQRRAIVVTHYVIGAGNPASFSTQGRAIYNELKDNSNLFLMLGGHISNEGQRQDTYNGNTVYSLLSDYQNRSNGGNGWLRIMEFQPASNQIQVKTYSTWLNQYETDANSQFTLSYPMSSYVKLGTISGVTSGSEASLSWPDLAPQTQYEWFVTVSDGGQTTTGSAWRFTTGTNANQPPAASDDAYQTSKDQPLVVSAQAGLLANDSDPENDPLTAVLVSGPANGSLDLGLDGSFSYTPTPGFEGNDSFSYQAMDAALSSNEAVATIMVTRYNNPPTAFDDAYQIEEDTTLSLPITGEGSPVSNDTDLDSDTLAVTAVSSTLGGAAQLADSMIQFTPSSELCGSAAGGFDYTVSDGFAGQDTGHVTVDIACVNDPPLAVGDNYATDQNVLLSVLAPGLMVNDSDPEHDPLVASLVSGPASGSVILNGDGSFSYTPNANFTGTDSFTYQVNDGMSHSPAASVTITVRFGGIFSDGFESGNFSAWTKNVNDSGDLSVSQAAALQDTNGMQALIDDNNAIYVSDESPSAETNYYARFYFDPNSIPMFGGNSFFIFYGYSGASTAAFRVDLNYSNTYKYQLRAGLYTDSATWKNSSFFPISDSPHDLEFYWRAATSAGANNGGLTFWIDGIQKSDLTGVDNDTLRVDQVRLGAVSGIDSDTRGAIYFDAFESTQQK